jgi:hypothetical protein
MGERGLKLANLEDMTNMARLQMQSGFVPSSYRGIGDVLAAMTRYAPALEQYHRLTTPSTWLEALVKTYVGDAMAADLYLAIAGSLPVEVADLVRSVLAETVHSQFVVAEVVTAVNSSGRQRSRLALWSRRLLGEAITQAQYLLAERHELVDLVLAGGGIGQITDLYERLQRTHSERMHHLGLA